MIKKKKGISRKGIAAGVLAGAGLGAVVGRRAAAAVANRNIEKRVMQRSEYNKKNNGYGKSPADITNTSAKEVYQSEYAKMPRVDSTKMATYKNLLDESRGRNGQGFADFKGSQKMAGMTKADLAKYYAKSDAKKTPGTSTYGYMDEAKAIRAKATRSSASRKGALVGGLSGAAISAIAQLVAAELGGKKRRG